jgi:hypothetical protein
MVEALRRGAGRRRRRRRHPALVIRRQTLVGIVLALVRSLGAQEPTVAQVGDVTVVAQPSELSLGMLLAETAGRPREWPGLGRRAPGPFRLIVVPDGEALKRMTGGRAPRWGAALALPRSRTILIRADADPTATLQHELAHLVLNEVIKSRVPLWFDEGYAVWAAGEWGMLHQLSLNLAVATSATPPLDTLVLALRGGEVQVSAAYPLAASAVLELARRNPSGSIRPLIERLAAGEEFGSAVHATTGLTLERFDETWQQMVRRRFSLFTWLIAGGAWFVFGALLVVGMRLRRRADRPRRLALDEGWELPDEADGAEVPERTGLGPEVQLDPPPAGE